MTKLISALAAMIIGLFIAQSASAQNLLNLSEYDARYGGVTQTASYPEIPAGWGWDEYNEYTPTECARIQGLWAPSPNGRILVCYRPEDEDGVGYTPYSPSRVPTPIQRYDTSDAVFPPVFPASICTYADHGRGCVSGETYFLRLVGELGNGLTAQARFRDDVEAMWRACGRLEEEPEEPRGYDRERRRSSVRYGGSGGGVSVRHTYERETLEERPTTDQVLYQQLLELRAEGAATCQIFRQEYLATSGWRGVRF